MSSHLLDAGKGTLRVAGTPSGSGRRRHLGSYRVCPPPFCCRPIPEEQHGRFGFSFLSMAMGRGCGLWGWVLDSKPGSPTYLLSASHQCGRFLCLGFPIRYMEQAGATPSATGTPGQHRGARVRTGKCCPKHGTLRRKMKSEGLGGRRDLGVPEWSREGPKLVAQWGALLPGPAQARWAPACTTLDSPAVSPPAPRSRTFAGPHLPPGKPVHPWVPAHGLVRSRNSKRLPANVN